MPFDSLVRTRQLNKPELSGYIVDVLLQYLRSGEITGIALNTGDLVNAFYPLSLNPSGYLTIDAISGLATKQEVTGNNTAILSYVEANYYPRNNPSGYLTSGSLSSGIMVKNTPNVFNLSDSGFEIFDAETQSKIVEYAPNSTFILRGFSGSGITGTPIINFEPGIGGRAYISGLDIYTQFINGQIALGSGDINSRFVSWDYFDSGKEYNFTYLWLDNPFRYGSLVFNDLQYLLIGQRAGYPSEQYFIDFYGNNALGFGLTYSKPCIYGFDIYGGQVKSSGYTVLTTKDSTGFVSPATLLTTSGALHDADGVLRTELIGYITGGSGTLYTYSGAGGVVVVQSGTSVIISGSGLYTTVTGDGSFVRTSGNQTITGNKTFYDILNKASLGTNSRVLYDASGNTSVGWASRYLFSADGDVALDWVNHQLFIPGEKYPTLNWQSGVLAVEGVTTLDWMNRRLSGDWSIDAITVSGQRPLTGAYLLTRGTQRYTGTLTIVSGTFTVSGFPVTTGGPYYPRGSNPSGYVTATGLYNTSDSFDPVFFRKVTGAAIAPVIGISVENNATANTGVLPYRYILQVQGWKTGELGRIVYSQVMSSGYCDAVSGYDLTFNWNPISNYTDEYILTLHTQPIGGGGALGPYPTGAWTLSDDDKNGINYIDISTWYPGTTGDYPLGAADNWVTFTGYQVQQIGVTGTYLTGIINILSIGDMGVFLSGVNTIVFSGTSGGYTGAFITTSQTGVLLARGETGQFAPIAQTGHIHSQYALSSNTGQFITTAQTGVLLARGETGQFAPIAQTGHIHSQYALSANTGQFITTAMTGVLTPRGETGHIHSQYALSAGTGQFITTAQTGVLTPRGETGHIHSQYALSANTGQFIDTSKTGVLLARGETGQFAPIAQTGHIHSQYALSSQTGQFVTTAMTGALLDRSDTGTFVNRSETGNANTLSSYELSNIVPRNSYGIINQSGIWFGTDIASGWYASFQGRILATDFNSSTLSDIIFKGTYGSATISITNLKAYVLGIPRNLTFFIHNGYLNCWMDAESGHYVNHEAIITLGQGYQGETFSRNAITGISFWVGLPEPRTGDITITPTQIYTSDILNTGLFAQNVNTGQFVTTAMTGVLTPRGETGHIHSQYALGSNTGQFITTAQTGVLTPRGETGHIHSQYALSAGTGQFISTAQTGVLLARGETGQFAPIAQTGHIHSQYALSSSTGQFVDTSKTGVLLARGETGNAFYPRYGNPEGYITDSQTGQFIVSGLTGTFVTTSMTGVLVSRGETGQFAPIAQTGHIHSQYVLKSETGQLVDSAESGVLTGAFVQVIDARNLQLNGFNIFSGYSQNLQGGFGSYRNVYYYPNVAVWTQDAVPAMTGAIVFNTPVNRSLRNMVVVHIEGYHYDDVKVQNILVGAYVSNGNVGNIDGLPGQVEKGHTAFVNLGDNTYTKAVGLNKSGNFAIAVNSTGAVISFSRYVANVWTSYQHAVWQPTGWSWSLETGQDFSFGDVEYLESKPSFVLATTGTTGEFITTAQTGHIHSQYALSSQTGQFIDTSKTGVLLARGETGQFAPIAQTGHIHSQYALSASTGQFIDTSKTGVLLARGETGNAFYPRYGNPEGYITDSQTGQFIVSGLTGTFVTTSMTGVLVSRGETGQFAPIAQTGHIHSQYALKSETGQFVDSAKSGLLVNVFPLRTETGHIHSQYALSSNTGQFITTAMTGVLTPRGETGHIHSQYALSSQTGQFVSTDMTGGFLDRSDTGIFVTTGQTGEFITSRIAQSWATSGLGLQPLVKSISVDGTGVGRNNYAGYVGMVVNFNTPVFVHSVGRYIMTGVPIYTGSHLVLIYDTTTATTVASAYVNTSGAASGQFAYTDLSSPFQVQTGRNYYILSREEAGGDHWFNNNTSVELSDVATLYYSGVYASTIATWALTPVPPITSPSAYVPPNILYSVGPIVTGILTRDFATRKYVQSRLQNLVTNGNGLMRDNTNFSSFVYSGAQVHGGFGAFCLTGGSNKILSHDEFIPVNPEKCYRVSFWIKAGNSTGGQLDETNSNYFTLSVYDSDGLTIENNMARVYTPACDTYLENDLVPGDTGVVIHDLSAWYTGTLTYYRNMVWWPYTNSQGYSYPPYTYTRNISNNIYQAYTYYRSGMWESGTVVSGNILPLISPWPAAFGTLPSGTPVSNYVGGGSYKYFGANLITSGWAERTTYMYGYDTDREWHGNRFLYGTALVKLWFLLNYGTTDPTNLVTISDVWISEMSSFNLEEASATIPGVVSTGAQTMIGKKSFSNDVLISGSSAVTSIMTGQFITTAKTGHIHSQYALSSETGQFITTAKTGQFAPAGLTGQFVTTAMTGALLDGSDTGLFVTTTQTGQYAPAGLTGQFVTTAMTGALLDRSDTGLFVTTTQTGQFAPIAQTGHIHSQYALSSSTGQFIDTSKTGVLLARGETGQFAPIAQTGHIHSQYALSSSTGQFVDTSKTGVLLARGETGQFAPIAQTGHIHSQYALGSSTGQFIDTSKTGVLLARGETGQFAPIAQTGHIHSQYALSSQTGQFISTAITGTFSSYTNTVWTTGKQAIGGEKDFTGWVRATGIRTGDAHINVGAGTWQYDSNKYFNLQGGTIVWNSAGSVIVDINNKILYDDIAGETHATLDWQTKTLSGTWNVGALTFNGVATGTAFYPRYGNPAGYVTSAGAGGVTSLIVTGSTLTGSIIFSGAANISVLTGYAGQNIIAISGWDTGQYITTAKTGVLLARGETGQFSPIAQTGHIHSQYALSSSTGQFVDTSKTGVLTPRGETGHIHSQYLVQGGSATGTLLGRGETGQFAPMAQTGHIHSQYALSSSTGQFIDTSKTGVLLARGETGQFAPIAQTGHIHSQYALSSQTGQFIDTSKTGRFAEYSRVVLITGNQTVGGVKSFSNDIQVNTSYIAATAGSGPQIGISAETLYGGLGTIESSLNWGARTLGLGGGSASRPSLNWSGGWLITGEQVTKTGVVLDWMNQYLMHQGSPTLNWRTKELSGTWNAQGLTIGGLSLLYGDTGQFITTAKTGVLLARGETGQFAPIAQTGHIHSQYALSSNTGQFITTAQTGQYAPAGMTGQFVTTNKTGVLTPRGETGHIHSQYALSSQTGQFIDTSKTGRFAEYSRTVWITGGQVVNGAKAFTGTLISSGANFTVYDSSQVLTATLSARTLNDTAGTTVADWGTRMLYESTSSPVLDWEHMILSGSWEVQKLIVAAATSTKTPSLVFRPGPLDTFGVPTAGAVEYDGTNLYFTDGSAVRGILSTGVGAGSTSIVVSGGGAIDGEVIFTGHNGINITGEGQIAHINAVRGVYNLPTGDGYGTTRHYRASNGLYYPVVLCYINWQSGESFRYVFKGSGGVAGGINDPTRVGKVHFIHTGVVDGKTILCSFVNTGVAFYATDGEPIFSGDGYNFSGVAWEDESLIGSPQFPGWVGITQSTTAQARADVYEFSSFGRYIYGKRKYANVFITDLIATQ